MQTLAGGTLDLSAKFSKGYLIQRLRTHKGAHIAEYEAARKVYFEELHEYLVELVSDASCSRLRDDNYQIDVYSKFKPPVNASKLYDQYIRMLELATDDEIELNADAYSSIVEDEWDWAKSAKSINVGYASRSKKPTWMK
jgi:hypothetical protein